jgi:hypothetical protein
MGNLVQGFVNQGARIATSVVMLMAIISVIRAWARAGGHVTVTVIGAVVLAGVVIWGVVNFAFLKNVTDKEATELNRLDNPPLLEPDTTPAP